MRVGRYARVSTDQQAEKYGIACGKGKGIIFKKGEQVAVVEEKDFFTALMREVEGLERGV